MVGCFPACLMLSKGDDPAGLLHDQDVMRTLTIRTSEEVGRNEPLQLMAMLWWTMKGLRGGDYDDIWTL